MKQGVLEKYREFLPVNESTPILSLGEGDTPLVRSRTIEGLTGCGELYFKLEGCNPTGSFKDRGMVVAVAKAIEAECESIYRKHERLSGGVRRLLRYLNNCTRA